MNWFLHGALGCPADWDAWRREDDVAVDLYADLAPYDEWATRFCTQVRALDAAPVLIGYSMGGRLALHALRADPGLWRRALIVSAHSGLKTEEERAARLKNDGAWAAKARQLPWDAFLGEWNTQPVLAGNVDALSGREALEARREAVAEAFDCWSLGRQANLLPFLENLNVPVTWLAGERDAKFTAVARTSVGNLPQGRLEIVADAGHRVPWEQPERFRTFVQAESG